MYCVAFSAVSQKRVCIVTVPCCMRTRFIACCKFAWLPVSVSVGSSCKRSKDLCVLSKYSFKAFCLNFVEAGSLSTWFLLRRTTMEASAVVGCFRVSESPTPSYITCQCSRITIEYLILRVRLPTHRWYLRYLRPSYQYLPAVPWYRTAACYAADENNGTENNRDDYALSCFRLRRDINPRAKN